MVESFKSEDGMTRAARGALNAQRARERDARRREDRMIASGLTRSALRLNGGSTSGMDQRLELTPEQQALKDRVDALAPALIDHAVDGMPLPSELAKAAKDPELRSLLTQRVLAATVSIAEAGDRPEIEMIAAERVSAWADQAAGEHADERIA